MSLNKIAAVALPVAIAGFCAYQFLSDPFFLRAFGLDSLADTVEHAEEKTMSVDKRAMAVVCNSEPLLACYQAAGAFGHISGRLTADLADDGSVTAASYSNGSAPEPVQTCLVGAVRSQHVPDFSGGAAQVRCEYAGTYMRGMQEMMYNHAFGRKSGGAKRAGRDK